MQPAVQLCIACTCMHCSSSALIDKHQVAHFAALLATYLCAEVLKKGEDQCVFMAALHYQAWQTQSMHTCRFQPTRGGDATAEQQADPEGPQQERSVGHPAVQSY